MQQEKKIYEQDTKLKRSCEHRKMKKEQGKIVGARGGKLEGAESMGENCERRKEHRPF